MARPVGAAWRWVLLYALRSSNIVQTSDNHYQVRLEGQWVDVPDDAVLEVPNKYGRAVVWYSKSWRSTVTGQEGGFYIRCFLPGELY